MYGTRKVYGTLHILDTTLSVHARTHYVHKSCTDAGHTRIHDISCRGRYRRIIQMRKSEPPSQILQILEISQIDCRNRRIIQMSDSEPPSQISQKLQISQTYCRNSRYYKYRRIIQMSDSEPPSQILQISQNDCRYRRIIQMRDSERHRR